MSHSSLWYLVVNILCGQQSWSILKVWFLFIKWHCFHSSYVVGKNSKVRCSEHTRRIKVNITKQLVWTKCFMIFWEIICISKTSHVIIFSTKHSWRSTAAYIKEISLVAGAVTISLQIATKWSGIRSEHKEKTQFRIQKFLKIYQWISITFMDVF